MAFFVILYLNCQVEGLTVICSVAGNLEKMPKGLAVLACPVVEPPRLQLIPLGLEVDRNTVIVLGCGISTNNVGKEVHLGVLLSKLERLVDTLADHQELDRAGEVTKLEEEPRHHLGALVASSLLHDPDCILRVVQFVKVKTNLENENEDSRCPTKSALLTALS